MLVHQQKTSCSSNYFFIFFMFETLSLASTVQHLEPIDSRCRVSFHWSSRRSSVMAPQSISIGCLKNATKSRTRVLKHTPAKENNWYSRCSKVKQKYKAENKWKKALENLKECWGCHYHKWECWYFFSVYVYIFVKKLNIVLTFKRR